MGKKHKVYLSLGSNLGNRLANLQKAIFRTQQQVGLVLDISSVYENPAIGFEGDDFLNICISVLTPLEPKALLDTLLGIEQEFGRVRSQGDGYSSRTLDIDIIYYGQEVINTGDLVIPHPQMQNR
ncbi:MAG: 2-amino-4-hydroxy-6-hydroxymethyldihydropteridine diphosphokinase, partial [Bacteroidota bacterium]|nr:2-amino-4-hydroxy-6-hydroxymethyldihydropteridine diphosphokinase [Bacteroidota bacterium]